MAGWKDIYDANSDKMSVYIHSSWDTFYSQVRWQSEQLSTLIEKIEDDVFNSFKTVITNMIGRELSFFQEVESSYLDFVNNNLKEIGEKPYKNIEELRSALEKSLSESMDKQEISILRSLVDISTGAEEYRKLRNKQKDKLKKVKDAGLRSKLEKEIDQEIKFKIEQEEWAKKLFSAIFALSQYLENKLKIWTKEPKKDIYNLASNAQKYRDLIIGLLTYGRNNGLMDGPISKKLLEDLKQKGSPEDLLEIISNMNTKALTYELTSPAFQNQQGKFTTPQMSKKLGEIYEDFFPEILTEIEMDNILLTGFESPNGERSSKLMRQAGQEYKDFNISDQLFGTVKTSSGQIVQIGASLKLKAEDSTNSEYVITNLWEGKLGPETFKTEGEAKLLDKASKHKNFINWMRNNIVTLESFSNRKESGRKEVVNFIQQITSLEVEVATLLLLPRFFNGFLKEIKKGEFAAFDATKMDTAPPLAFTLFVVSNQKVYLTSDLIRKVWLSFTEGTEVQGFKSSGKGWEGDRNILRSSNLAEKLWKDKEEAFKTLEQISYEILMKNDNVKSTLNKINDSLRYRSISSKIYYEINFEKVIGGR